MASAIYKINQTEKASNRVHVLSLQRLAYLLACNVLMSATDLFYFGTININKTELEVEFVSNMFITAKSVGFLAITYCLLEVAE